MFLFFRKRCINPLFQNHTKTHTHFCLCFPFDINMDDKLKTYSTFSFLYLISLSSFRTFQFPFSRTNNEWRKGQDEGYERRKAVYLGERPPKRFATIPSLSRSLHSFGFCHELATLMVVLTCLLNGAEPLPYFRQQPQDWKQQTHNNKKTVNPMKFFFTFHMFLVLLKFHLFIIIIIMIIFLYSCNARLRRVSITYKRDKHEPNFFVFICLFETLDFSFLFSSQAPCIIPLVPSPLRSRPSFFPSSPDNEIIEKKKQEEERNVFWSNKKNENKRIENNNSKCLVVFKSLHNKPRDR